MTPPGAQWSGGLASCVVHEASSGTIADKLFFSGNRSQNLVPGERRPNLLNPKRTEGHFEFDTRTRSQPFFTSEMITCFFQFFGLLMAKGLGGNVLARERFITTRTKNVREECGARQVPNTRERDEKGCSITDRV